MTTAETALKERVNKIKRVLYDYIDAKKENPNANTDVCVEELFSGNNSGIDTISSLITNAVQSRPSEKSSSDQKKLASNPHNFKVVKMFLDLSTDIEKYAKRNRITIDADSFLDGKIKEINKSFLDYTEEMKKHYNIAEPANNIGQAVNAMPENNGIPAANSVPAVNPAPNTARRKPYGPIRAHKKLQ